jgi:hypothetical protein
LCSGCWERILLIDNEDYNSDLPNGCNSRRRLKKNRRGDLLENFIILLSLIAVWQSQLY